MTNRTLPAPQVLVTLILLALIVPLSACGADSFLRTSARVHSFTKSTRIILENIYDDKLASRETVLEIARPLARFQTKQVEVFETWKRHRNPDTGEITLTPEVAADFAAILVSLKSDFGAFKQQTSNDKLPSPAVAMLQPAIQALEREFDDYVGQLAGIKGVSKRGVFRLLRAQSEQLDRQYAELLKESEDIAVWTN